MAAGGVLLVLVLVYYQHRTVEASTPARPGEPADADSSHEVESVPAAAKTHNPVKEQGKSL